MKFAVFVLLLVYASEGKDICNFCLAFKTQAEPLQWNPGFSNLLRKGKFVKKNREFEKIKGDIDWKRIQGKRVFVRIIGRFEKSRARENEIPL